MKLFVVILTFVGLCCCFMSSAQATPERQKRSIAREMCPENTTFDQCRAYAHERSKTFKYCHRFIIGGRWIEWQTCGSVSCGGNTMLVAEDLSKPYPNCCEHCELVNPSRPVFISGSVY